MRTALLAFAFALLATTARAQLDDLDPAPVAGLPAGTRVLRDQPYGSDPKQRVDVYLPAQVAPGAPTIVMVHGGAWRIGSKTSRGVVQNKAARWLPRGAIFVSVDNRLLPQASVAQQADDVAHALAEVQRRLPSWGGDPAKVVLMGHSAGAHLVALLASSPTRATAAGARPWLGTVALDSAAMDLPRIMNARHPRLYDVAFGDRPDDWRAVSPIDQLAPGVRPMLLVCSSRRRESCDQARAYAARIDGQARVLSQDLTHADINATLGLSGGYTDAVEAFLRTLDPVFAATP